MTGIPIHVVWDCSGSMDDMGKMQIAIDVVSVLRHVSRHGGGQAHALRLALWSNGPVIFTDLVDGGPVTVPSVPTGTACMDSLVDALDALEAAPITRLLMLSDGAFGDAAARKLRQWLRRSRVTAKAIAIGADAAWPALRSIFDRESVFSAPDAALAMTWRPMKSGGEHPPVSLNDVIWPFAASSEDSDDDWN